jgi:glutathione S-transferase
VTVGISHYAEKVRWGLDIKRSDPTFDYVEDAHPPALASLFTTRLDPGCSATPIIELREGEKVSVMKDSTAILEHLCPFLYPEERLGEVREWEERLDRLLGTTSRVFAYEHMLAEEHKPLLVELATAGTSMVETKVFQLAINRNILQKNMKRFMKIDAANATRSRAEIDVLYKEVSDHLATSPYLAGPTFTAADLTFAALSSPLLNVPEFGGLQPGFHRFPTQMQQAAAELRETPAGKHALRCYAEYRFAAVRGGKVEGSPSKGRLIAFRGGGRNAAGARKLGVAGGLLALGLGAWLAL